MKDRIHYTKPSITAKEIEFATDAAANGWGERCYDYIKRFETKFAEYLGVKHAIATSSCTGALHLGLAALGISQGDEVLLADSNWIATVAPVVHLGATPKFLDILPDTWCIDPDFLEKEITPHTKAIIAVHLYGNPCNMNALLDIGNRHNIPIVEDAAEAVGTEYHGRKAGSMGRFGAFSFHGTKTLTTGEGGMFVTNDDELYEMVLTMSNHGRSRSQSKQFWPDIIGYKHKMSNIQAAIGLAQLERIDELTSKKRWIQNWYRDHIKELRCAQLNPEPECTTNGAWMNNVLFSRESGVTREKLQLAFAQENIDARVFFWPLSSLPMFTPCRNNVNAWDIPSRSINLPSFHDISEDEMRRVLDVLRTVTR